MSSRGPVDEQLLLLMSNRWAGCSSCPSNNAQQPDNSLKFYFPSDLDDATSDTLHLDLWQVDLFINMDRYYFRASPAITLIFTIVVFFKSHPCAAHIDCRGSSTANHSSVHSFIHSFVHSFIRWFLYSFIRFVICCLFVMFLARQGSRWGLLCSRIREEIKRSERLERVRQIFQTNRSIGENQLSRECWWFPWNCRYSTDRKYNRINKRTECEPSQFW